MRDAVLGPEAGFTAFPAEVEVGRDAYYLTKDEESGAYTLLSRTCPHAGYIVDAEVDEFYCPMHGWSFDLTTGQCLNVPTQALTAHRVIRRDGMLVALLED